MSPVKKKGRNKISFQKAKTTGLSSLGKDKEKKKKKDKKKDDDGRGRRRSRDK